MIRYRELKIVLLVVSLSINLTISILGGCQKYIFNAIFALIYFNDPYIGGS